jgi:hypothetical protein
MSQPGSLRMRVLRSRRSVTKPKRLLKNAHLRRSPNPSPCQARGKLVAAYYFKYASFVSSWA